MLLFWSTCIHDTDDEVTYTECTTATNYNVHFFITNIKKHVKRGEKN